MNHILGSPKGECSLLLFIDVQINNAPFVKAITVQNCEEYAQLAQLVMKLTSKDAF